MRGIFIFTGSLRERPPWALTLFRIKVHQTATFTKSRTSIDDSYHGASMSLLRYACLRKACSSRVSSRTTWTRRYGINAGIQRSVQSYVSSSNDPYVNLSIEHWLLQEAPADSAILFLYVNRPSVIIGRNQNPWFEVNLARLQSPALTKPELATSGRDHVDLVRRRSGGGTVFHDEGNINWTVISPSESFTRDKHAEMVVRALRSCGIDRSRVNARHDIVIDQGDRGAACDPEDTHQTPYLNDSGNGPRSLKVSGSAYKLTRKRALHHGTCLLSSPNLSCIHDYLRSPSKPYMTARGVESVSSPVGNVHIKTSDFMSAVQEQFAQMYGDSTFEELGEGMMQNDRVRAGYVELKSLEWTFLQTPQFSISSAPALGDDLSIQLSVRHGAVDAVTANGKSAQVAWEQAAQQNLIGLRLHEVSSWETAFGSSLRCLNGEQSKFLLNWLQKTLPPLEMFPARADPRSIAEI